MTDERRPQSDQSQNDRFEDALDELFGPDTNEPEPGPAQVAEPAAPAPPSTAVWPSPGSEPEPHKRSLARTAAIGCVAIIVILFACLVVLLVIGLVAGEDSGTAAMSIAPHYSDSNLPGLR